MPVSLHTLSRVSQCHTILLFTTCSVLHSPSSDQIIDRWSLLEEEEGVEWHVT